MPIEGKNKSLEGLSTGDKKSLGLAAINIENLIKDVQKSEYASLEDDIHTIHNNIADITGDKRTSVMLLGKLIALQNGLKDRKSSNFNDSLRALQDLKGLSLKLAK